MGIQKRDYYEGAALHQLIRGWGGAKSIAYSSPFFIVDHSVAIYLKYSTAKRSPWGFTFMPAEQVLLRQRASEVPLLIGLICGADGVAAMLYEDYNKLASQKDTAVRVSCKRNHRQHFEIGGPDGVLPNRVAPSDWISFLSKEERLA